MEKYEVVRVASREEFLNKVEELPRAYVKNYPWNCPRRPETFGVLGWDDEFLHIYMRSYDDDRRAEASCDNGDIYKDSCMEFFANPSDESDFFINFEVNPKGYLYLAYGPSDESKRTLLTSEEYKHFGIEIRDIVQDGEYWDFCASVPFAFFEKYAPGFKMEKELSMTGNFFKCGDETKSAHYGCWNNITDAGETPFFYRPDCFGVIDFVNK